ncbi:hypothetical protein PR048_010517 [Dryococelus australis]|uniref:Uncharacterized protein n=1 Tax=Dryococelus australis TaxID=614101 RepID=A0ABQ9I4Y2_9NEOP|nr:hypothetical protein PR048_010517 [Dryococelus australis]
MTQPPSFRGPALVRAGMARPAHHAHAPFIKCQRSCASRVLPEAAVCPRLPICAELQPLYPVFPRLQVAVVPRRGFPRFFYRGGSRTWRRTTGKQSAKQFRDRPCYPIKGGWVANQYRYRLLRVSDKGTCDNAGCTKRVLASPTYNNHTTISIEDHLEQTVKTTAERDRPYDLLNASQPDTILHRGRSFIGFASLSYLLCDTTCRKRGHGPYVARVSADGATYTRHDVRVIWPRDLGTEHQGVQGSGRGHTASHRSVPYHASLDTHIRANTLLQKLPVKLRKIPVTNSPDICDEIRGAGIKGRSKREITEKTPGSPWWEVSRLTAQPPRLHGLMPFERALKSAHFTANGLYCGGTMCWWEAVRPSLQVATDTGRVEAVTGDAPTSVQRVAAPSSAPHLTLPALGHYFETSAGLKVPTASISVKTAKTTAAFVMSKKKGTDLRAFWEGLKKCSLYREQPIPRRKLQCNVFRVIHSDTATSRGRSVVAVRLLDSHIRERGSIPGGGRSPIFACGNRAGRCRWSVDFLGNLLFPPPSQSGAAPYSHRFTPIGPQELAVKGRPNLSTPLPTS